MPNHVTNKLEFISESESEIVTLIESYSTFHPSVERTAFNGAKIAHNKNTGSYGWMGLDGIFETRVGRAMVVTEWGSDWEFEYTEEFTQFPDFDKVFPKPENFHDVISDGYVLSLQNPFIMKSPAEVINEIHAQVTDTNRVVEILENFNKALENVKNFGYPSWYEMNIKTWGTKWNSYSCKNKNGAYYFDTAWNSPTPVIEKMSLDNPNVTIIHSYFDEGWNFWGIDQWIAGQKQEIHINSGDLKEDEIGIELCKDLKDYNPTKDEDEEYCDEEE